MKKLFFALALTGFVSAAAIGTVSAMTHNKIVMKCKGDDDKKKKEKCSKDKACCKSTATASETSKCSAAGGEKKCCHATAKAADGKATTVTEVKTDVKKTEEQK